jgi:lysophospholipase L1-like esterase
MMRDAKLQSLFLGDSYTAGTAVAPKLRWPMQLIDRIQNAGWETETPRLIAGNGWTTDDLLRALDIEAPPPIFDLVFLMIGVNDQFHGRPFADFQAQFKALVDRATKLARSDPSRVFVLAIPDYSVTPFAAERNPTEIASQIDLHNAQCRRTSKNLGVEFLDTVEISRQAGCRRELLVEDGLHPSAEMYRLWSDFVFDRIKGRLGEN